MSRCPNLMMCPNGTVSTWCDPSMLTYPVQEKIIEEESFDFFDYPDNFSTRFAKVYKLNCPVVDDEQYEFEEIYKNSANNDQENNGQNIKYNNTSQQVNSVVQTSPTRIVQQVNSPTQTYQQTAQPTIYTESNVEPTTVNDTVVPLGGDLRPLAYDNSIKDYIRTKKKHNTLLIILFVIFICLFIIISNVIVFFTTKKFFK